MGDEEVTSHDWVIGCSIRVQTKHTNEEVGGTVFGYDPTTDTLMLKEPGSHGGVVNLRLYKAAQLQVLQADRPKQPVDTRLTYVDKDRARQREEKALQQAESDMAKVGEGVTKEAQTIFDSLSKTLPCVWRGKAIIVMDSIAIQPPYTVDHVKPSTEGSSGDKAAMDRIKRVLAAERKRLNLDAAA